MDIFIPSVGESITEVGIGQWLKKDGDFVEMDEPIAELESDKASFELPAEQAGILQIIVQEGETIAIGGKIATITPSEKSDIPTKVDDVKISTLSTETSQTPKPTGEIKEMIIPTVGESITDVTLSQWIKKDGDFVTLDEPIAEIESDKASLELPAEATGILTIVAKEDDVIPIGGLVAKIKVMEDTPSSDTTSTTPVTEEKTIDATSGADNYATGHPSPAASKILDEKNISPQAVQGTGRDGRITKEDALVAKQSVATPTKSATPTTPTTPTTSSASVTAQLPIGLRNETRKKMSSLRKTIAKRLVNAKNSTAMLTTFNEVDMKPIMDIRKKYKESFKEKYGVNLGFMSFFTKAVCLALEDWPSVSAIIDGDEIIYHDYCDISIAVSSSRGLVVPVIRNAEQLDFKGVESEVVRLAKKARDNKLTIEEMTGGNFTITNGGIFGSMLSTPIINAPQSAILGMHNIVQRPVAINGEVQIRPIMFVALSYDHRVIDGRESVSFLYRIKELLEDPQRLLLNI